MTNSRLSSDSERLAQSKVTRLQMFEIYRQQLTAYHFSNASDLWRTSIKLPDICVRLWFALHNLC